MQPALRSKQAALRTALKAFVVIVIAKTFIFLKTNTSIILWILTSSPHHSHSDKHHKLKNPHEHNRLLFGIGSNLYPIRDFHHHGFLSVLITTTIMMMIIFIILMSGSAVQAKLLSSRCEVAYHQSITIIIIIILSSINHHHHHHHDTIINKSSSPLSS